jgi:hypothetical protein
MTTCAGGSANEMMGESEDNPRLKFGQLFGGMDCAAVANGVAAPRSD